MLCLWFLGWVSPDSGFWFGFSLHIYPPIRRKKENLLVFEPGTHLVGGIRIEMCMGVDSLPFLMRRCHAAPPQFKLYRRNAAEHEWASCRALPGLAVPCRAVPCRATPSRAQPRYFSLWRTGPLSSPSSTFSSSAFARLRECDSDAFGCGLAEQPHASKD